MSRLKKMIEEKRTNSSQTIATTLRLSAEINSTVEEIAWDLGISKQETLVLLIEDGIESTFKYKKWGDVAPVPADCTYHLLNTNKRNNAQDGQWMLANGIAAAFYKPWNEHINTLKPGDVVFLYENGTGIVGWGRATGKTEVKDYYGDVDETHYQVLEDFHKLDKALTAREIRQILNYELPFLRTMIAVSDGGKILDAIQSKSA